MIYFDAAYLAKCYLNEPGAERVRDVARQADGLASCELARIEFAAILKRHARERHITRREMSAVLREFEEDEENGGVVLVRHYLGSRREGTPTVLQLPTTVFIRSGDALHLTCAEENGFREVYTNDRHMLAAARHFRLKGVDVVGEQ